MGKNKLDAINFCKIFDLFGEEAAKQTLADVNAGRCRESTIEKYLYGDSETKQQYAQRLRREYKNLK